MERFDSGFEEPFLPASRDRLRKRSFEVHQLLPIDTELLTVNALAGHTASPIRCFGGSDQHFFGVAPAQGTCPAKRPRINDGNTPPSLTARRTPLILFRLPQGQTRLPYFASPVLAAAILCFSLAALLMRNFIEGSVL
jgi:hypothetical protein